MLGKFAQRGVHETIVQLSAFWGLRSFPPHIVSSSHAEWSLAEAAAADAEIVFGALEGHAAADVGDRSVMQTSGKEFPFTCIQCALGGACRHIFIKRFAWSRRANDVMKLFRRSVEDRLLIVRTSGRTMRILLASKLPLWRHNTFDASEL